MPSKDSKITKYCKKKYRLECYRNEEKNFYVLINNLNNQKRIPKDKLKTDFENVTKILKISYEREFMKHKLKLKNKFELLTKKEKTTTKKNSTINTPVLQLQTTPLPLHALALLSNGQKFSLSPKTIPYMDIILETEKAAQNSKHAGLPENEEKLRQNILNVLHNTLNKKKKIKNNLNNTERKRLEYLKRDQKWKVGHNNPR